MTRRGHVLFYHQGRFKHHCATNASVPGAEGLPEAESAVLLTHDPTSFEALVEQAGARPQMC